ncbi:MAG: EAL domain-containing protein [Clostridia bacterium]|nr:EAL domain-containing protein [Clostridia bacterium]
MNGKYEENLTERFHEAVSSGRIRAFYQPIIRSLTQQMTGVETLARWFEPDGSVLSPDFFIPSMEQSGLIFELDMEILRQACALYDTFRRRGTPLPFLSVNLSRHDFVHPELFDRICGILDRYSVPHEAIKLEITESLMLEDTESFERLFEHFHEAGFSVWLDDFGSGYSSLNVLQNYRFDVIKFDMLFLRDFSIRGQEMLASLIGMAKTLGIHTLTEGVETDEQRQFLLAAGCETQQGFYYSRPIPEEELIEHVDHKPGLLENTDEVHYWDEVGRLNFLNPNPLKEFTARRRSGLNREYMVNAYDSSIALVECGADGFRYIYATEGYRDRLRELGFSSVEGLENALSNQRSHQYQMIRKLVLDALQRGTVQTVEYAHDDVYYRLSALFLARRDGRAMIVMHLNTFDSEREVELRKEMLNDSSALFTTYELVVMFYPEKRKAKRIYTSNNMPDYDREESFDQSLSRF